VPRRSIHRARLGPREALLFEAGIKLGGIFHQYLGIPVSARTAPGLARAIERAVSLQPYVRSVRVRLELARGGPLGRGRFGYRYLTGEMLDVRLVLAEGPVSVRARLAQRPDLRYPLMSVEAVGPGADRARRARRSARRRGRSVRRSAM
jgi:dihydroneopterin aldolase